MTISIIMDIMTRLIAFWTRIEKKEKSIDNWDIISEVINLLNKMAIEIRYEQDTDIEMSLLNGKWTVLSKLLADELTDDIVIDCILKCSDMFVMYKSILKLKESIPRAPRALKHKFEISDDECNNNNNSEFITVKPPKNKKIKDSKISNVTQQVPISNSFAVLDNEMEIDNVNNAPIMNNTNTSGSKTDNPPKQEKAY